MTAQILVVEDDDQLGKQILERMRRAGFDVRWLRDGATAMTLDPHDFVMLVLDLMLPGPQGFSLLSRWRQRSDLPVLVLSTTDDADVKVRAFELGADDFLSKPFWPEELLARVKARLRRPLLMREDRIDAGVFMIDVEARVAKLSGRLLDLTRVEFEILCALARRSGSAIARRWLVDNVLDPRRHGDERTLDVHVSRLRKKLGDQGIRLVTVWGVGYRLRSDDGDS
jgi:DNA-binding response OmpR family regulator